MRVALREIAAKQSRTFNDPKDKVLVGPKQALLEALGDVSWYEPFHNLVLIATYVPPETSAGGIIIPDRSLAEARFQGVAGLVLRRGPAAFRDEGHVKFYGVMVEEGDWIVYKPSDAMEQFVRKQGSGSDGVSVRLIQDIHIKGRVPDPALIY
jgi:co-chaperonin GroES (HSP10)